MHLRGTVGPKSQAGEGESLEGLQEILLSRGRHGRRWIFPAGRGDLAQRSQLPRQVSDDNVHSPDPCQPDAREAHPEREIGVAKVYGGNLVRNEWGDAALDP